MSTSTITPSETPTITTTTTVRCELSDAHCGSHLVPLHIRATALTARGIELPAGRSSYDRLMKLYDLSRLYVTKRYMKEQLGSIYPGPYARFTLRILGSDEVKQLPVRSTRLLDKWRENMRLLNLHAQAQERKHATCVTTKNKKAKSSTAATTVCTGAGAGTLVTAEAKDGPDCADEDEEEQCCEQDDAVLRVVHRLPPVWKVCCVAPPDTAAAAFFQLVDQRECLCDDDASSQQEDFVSTLRRDIAMSLLPSLAVGDYVTLDLSS